MAQTLDSWLHIQQAHNMALYTIRTTRVYEAALQHNYEFYADKANQTIEQYFQMKIDQQVLAIMDSVRVNDKTTNLTASMATVPEANQPKLITDIEEDIIANGGTIITGPAIPPIIPPPLGSVLGGVVSDVGQQGGPTIQTGPTNQSTPNTSRPDGPRDNKT